MSVQELTLKLFMGSFLGQDSYKRDLSSPIVETRVILLLPYCLLTNLRPSP